MPAPPLQAQWTLGHGLLRVDTSALEGVSGVKSEMLVVTSFVLRALPPECSPPRENVTVLGAFFHQKTPLVPQKLNFYNNERNNPTTEIKASRWRWLISICSFFLPSGGIYITSTSKATEKDPGKLVNYP